MTFKAKLRQIGNSIGVIIPLKVITDYTLGEEIELQVITKGGNKDSNVITDVFTGNKQKVIHPQDVITTKSFNTMSCSKHEGSMKGTCGCK